MHDFMCTYLFSFYGFDFTKFSCQAGDLGQGFHVLKIMGLLNQNNAHVWYPAPEIVTSFLFCALVMIFSVFGLTPCFS